MITARDDLAWVVFAMRLSVIVVRRYLVLLEKALKHG